MDSLTEVKPGDEVFMRGYTSCGMDEIYAYWRVTITRAAKETLYVGKERFRRDDGTARDELSFRRLVPINSATLLAKEVSDARLHKESVRWEMLNLMEKVSRHGISVSAMEQIIAIIKQDLAPKEDVDGRVCEL